MATYCHRVTLRMQANTVLILGLLAVVSVFEFRDVVTRVCKTVLWLSPWKKNATPKTCSVTSAHTLDDMSPAIDV